MHGKLMVDRYEGSWLESTFYWPSESGCTENDQHFILDLMIVWSKIEFERLQNQQLWDNIMADIDETTKHWVAIDTNIWLHDRVKLYSNYYLCAIINIIWSSGFAINTMRKYYEPITKAAKDLEACSKVGYKKLVFSKVVAIPTSIDVEGIIRKRTLHYYAITAVVIDRRKANLSDLKEFLSLKDQVQNKEKMSVFEPNEKP